MDRVAAQGRDRQNTDTWEAAVVQNVEMFYLNSGAKSEWSGVERVRVGHCLPGAGAMNGLELPCGGTQEARRRSRGPVRGAAQPGSSSSGMSVVIAWRHEERAR